MILSILGGLAITGAVGALVWLALRPLPSAVRSDDEGYVTYDAPYDPDQEDIVTLVDEEGKNHDFQVVDVIEVGAYEYALLLPAAQPDGEDEEVLVLRINEADDRFEMIEDEAEFTKVVAALEELASHE